MGRAVLGSKAIQQVKETYARVKNMPFGSAGPRHPTTLWNPGTVRAIVTTAITACSGTTPGTGAADIWRRQVDGTMAMTENVPVANWSQTSGTVAIGLHVLICWCDAEWEFVVRDCP